jgi:protein-disulfide isomerase
LSQEKLGEQVSIWAKAMPGLDQAQFQRCVANSLTSGQIEQDIALGKELGVRGTPTIFVNGELAAGSSADEIRTLIR